MGTYTPNYGLYKPDIGEKGWGDKVNANFDTIDSVMHENRSQISRIKKDMLTIALNVMMNKALLFAETKDFYSIIADVITDEYPYGFKNTFETVPSGVKFDNDGGGTWTRAIKITLTTVPSEYAQYRIVIQSNTMQIYSADGTLKADYGANTGVASDFWNNVKSDGSDIRVADQNYSQLYFWIEEFDYSGKYAVIWVKIPANTTVLYIVYGNPSATKSNYENGDKVFEFFDDFNTLDNWRVVRIGGSGYAKVEEGYLKLYSTDKKTTVDTAITLSNCVVDAKVFVVNNADAFTIALTKGSYDSDGHATDEYEAYWAGWPTKVERQRIYKRVGGSWTELGKTSNGLPENNKTYILSFVFHPPTLKMLNDYGEILSTTDNAFTELEYLALAVWEGGEYWVDWVRVLKLADPAEFGDAEVITLTTTGDFITVTFDFPEGVDKLLITVDTDAQAIYYSTDDGQTWNAIEPDTETPLPETAYSVKWKFEFATYVRGYAFITW